MPHNLVHRVDANGRSVVGVHLSNSHQPAWLHRTDYERIIEEYGTPSWRLTPNGNGKAYVRFKQIGLNARNVTVARLVAGDFDRTGIKYKDRDPLNLRSENLYHGDGRGGCPQNSRRKSRALLSHANDRDDEAVVCDDDGGRLKQRREKMSAEESVGPSVKGNKRAVKQEPSQTPNVEARKPARPVLTSQAKAIPVVPNGFPMARIDRSAFPASIPPAMASAPKRSGLVVGTVKRQCKPQT